MLNRDRGYILASRSHNKFFNPARYVDETLIIYMANISGMHKSLAINSLQCLSLVVQVALKLVSTSHANLSLS